MLKGMNFMFSLCVCIFSPISILHVWLHCIYLSFCLFLFTFVCASVCMFTLSHSFLLLITSNTNILLRIIFFLLRIFSFSFPLHCSLRSNLLSSTTSRSPLYFIIFSIISPLLLFLHSTLRAALYFLPLNLFRHSFPNLPPF